MESEAIETLIKQKLKQNSQNLLSVLKKIYSTMSVRQEVAKNICLTVNNWTQADYDSIWNCALFGYVVIGKEVAPTTGTAHLQCYAQLLKRMRLTTVARQIPRAHIEPAQAKAVDAANYCKKGEQSKHEWRNFKEYGTHFGLNADFAEKGVLIEQGARIDLREAINTLTQTRSIRRVAETHPEVFIRNHRGITAYALITVDPYVHTNCRGIWIYGPPGTGKSHCVREQFPTLFVKPQNKWWDGYDAQECVLLDDLDTPVLGHYLKIWSDKYSCTGESKGGTVMLRHKVFVVTSNFSIEELFTGAHGCDNNMVRAIQRRFYEQSKFSRADVIDFASDSYFEQLADD